MGDLINRRELLKALDVVGEEVRGMPLLPSERAIVLGSKCESIVRNAPAVDAEPVRHGKWVMDTNPNSWYFRTVSCSECSRTNSCGVTPYCPNCGAKMDKEENE